MEGVLVWFEAHPGAASWVQAVGAICAILVSALVVILQHKLETRARKLMEADQKVARLETAYQLSFWAHTVAEKLVVFCRTPNIPLNVLNNIGGELISIGNALEKFQPSDFNGYAELAPVMKCLSAVKALDAHVRISAQRCEQINQSSILGIDAAIIKQELLISCDHLRAIVKPV